jgi:hypothetical protein
LHKVTGDETNTFAMTIAIFIVVSQVQYGPDVEKVAENFKTLLNVTSCRTIAESAPTGVGEIRRYLPGRRNDAPYFDMLITHEHWPLKNPGVPTAFECRADDVYVRLQDPGFEIPNRVDAENRAEGPAKGEKKKGGGASGLAGVGGDAVDWYDSDGEPTRPGKKKGCVRTGSWRNYCAWRKRHLPSPLSRSVHT